MMSRLCLQSRFVSSRLDLNIPIYASLSGILLAVQKYVSGCNENTVSPDEVQCTQSDAPPFIIFLCLFYEISISTEYYA